MRCVYCYEPLAEGEVDFHPSCSMNFFGQRIPPLLPYTEAEMEKLATEVLKTQMTVTGVQPKLSLELESPNRNEPKRLTIVGLWGEYILKPTSPKYPHTSEVEDLTMHLASIAKIKVVPHSLIRLQSGQLAYITRRIDRIKKKKIHMEDLCQLSELLTEHKYRSSYEKTAKIIVKYSTNPLLDVVNFYEEVLFSFLTGNSDMHLKNFSLIHDQKTGPILSPAYDMLATSLVNPDDREELALNLNGKKRKIDRDDFTAAFSKLLDKQQEENIFKKMEKARPQWMGFIEKSFLNDELKGRYVALLNERFDRMSIN